MLFDLIEIFELVKKSLKFIDLAETLKFSKKNVKNVNVNFRVLSLSNYKIKLQPKCKNFIKSY